MAENDKCAACQADDAPEELRLLRKMSGQMDGLDDRLEKVEGRAIKAGAVAGAVAGAAAGYVSSGSGGLVSAGIAILKAKFGM